MRGVVEVAHAPVPTNGPPICAMCGMGIEALSYDGRTAVWKHKEPYFRMVDQFGHPMDEPCDCGRPTPWSRFEIALVFVVVTYFLGALLWMVTQ